MDTLKLIAPLLLSIAMTLTPISLQAQDDNGRMMIITVEAEVTAVDYDTRELSLRGPQGEIQTITAGDNIERLADIAVGDTVSTTYMASLAGELREPTEEEKAKPWIELTGAEKAPEGMDPGAIVGRQIQAVCTIEGMNRVTRTVTVRDPKGKYHLIGDVDPAKMEGVTLGTTVVLTYTEAMAVTLEKKVAAAQ